MPIPLSELRHTSMPLSGGGKVVVLNTGAAINPEAEAMLQALHSRSLGGIDGHLNVLHEKGAEKFMATFYVGYGHKSIGDCGSATLFIEGVSMLAAKAIQDWPLYSGQEASTRYIDFEHQPFIDPLGTEASRAALEAWRTFYLGALPKMKAMLCARFPKQAEEKDAVYEKAIAARAFDTLRAFLPAGAATNLAWHSNLRQFADKLMYLRHHPLAEVREIGEAAERALLEAFPSSFSDKRYDATEAYHAQTMQHYYFQTGAPSDFALRLDSIDRDLLRSYRVELETRPPKTDIPKWLAECGTLQFEFLLDFGSYRDLQRHRAITGRMPLLTTEHGFGGWYLEELPDDLRREAEDLIRTERERIMALGASPEITQYYLAMGYQVPVRLTGSLPAFVYLAELRATRFVHPTLRKRAIQMAEVMRERFSPYGLTLHLDAEPDRFDARRGEHDITVRL